MLNVLRSLFLIVALGFSLSSLAQKPDSLQKVKPGYAGVSIVKGDTIRNYMLEDITVVASDSAYKAKYDRYVRYIRRAYPYAMLAKQIATEMDTDLLQVNSKKQSKKMVKEEYEALKEKFTDGIKILTVNEGKVLMKLIYRETGMTAYELTDKYLGTGKAFMWQAISRSGGANLKLTYEPSSGDDRIIEDIVKKVESKKIWVPSEPFVPEDRKAYLRQRREAVKEWERKQKMQKKAKADATAKLTQTPAPNDNLNKGR